MKALNVSVKTLGQVLDHEVWILFGRRLREVKRVWGEEKVAILGILGRIHEDWIELVWKIKHFRFVRKLLLL